MFGHLLRHASWKPQSTVRRLALLLLVTAGATWVWAHEGHQPLPSSGAEPIADEKGNLVGYTLNRKARESIDVQLADVEQQPLEERVLAYATLVTPWQKHAYATSRLPGRIVKLHARPGQTVKAGDPLAEIESLELENLKAELLNARNDIELSERILEKIKPLVRDGSTPGQALFEAETALLQHQNASSIAESKWLSLGLNAADLKALYEKGKSAVLRALPILSPIGGTVIHADLTVGKVIEPAEHLFEIVDLSTVWAKIGVLERDMDRVQVGQKVELSLAAYPGEVFRSTVQVKGLHLDPQTHLNTVWAEFKNQAQSPRLHPGLYGQAQILLPASAKGWTVPSTALIRDGLERYVLVEQSSAADSSQYLKANVIVERRTADRVQIRSAQVYKESRVVTRGAHELAPFFTPGVLRIGSEAAHNIGLRAESVRLQNLDEVTELEGAVDVPPDRRTFAALQLPGTIQKILVERGQSVRAGEVLAEVSSLELQNLQLDLIRSDLEIQLQEQTLKRLEEVGRAIPERQVWEARSRTNASRIRRDSLWRKSEAVGLSPEQIRDILKTKNPLQTLPLRAPVAGAVVRFDRILGQAVKADEPLFEIHDLKRPWVKGYVAAAQVNQVRLNQRVRVRLTATPSEMIEGTVVRSGQVLEEENRSLSIWVDLDRYPNRPLLHNQLARLTLTQRQFAPVLAVPLSAVAREGTSGFVFVRRRDDSSSTSKSPEGIYDRRAVETGKSDDRFVEIRSGLDEGEEIAVTGVTELQTAHASLR